MKLVAETLLTAPASTIEFTNIPPENGDLLVMGNVDCGNTVGYLTINNDESNNAYVDSELRISYVSGAASQTVANFSPRIPIRLANNGGFVEVKIIDYGLDKSTSTYRNIQIESFLNDLGDDEMYALSCGHISNSNNLDAINRIKFSGSFNPGTEFKVFIIS